MKRRGMVSLRVAALTVTIGAIGIATALSSSSKTPFWQSRGVLVDVVKKPTYIAEYTLRFGPQGSYAGSGGGLGWEHRVFPNGLTYIDHDEPAFRRWRDEFTGEELHAWEDGGYTIPEHTPPMRVRHPEIYGIILTQHKLIGSGDRDYLFGGIQIVTRAQYEVACEFLGVEP